MKVRGVFAVGLVVCLTGAALAGGFSKVYPLPTNGVLTVVNEQANSVWKTCVLSVVCTNSAERTVTVSRVVGSLVYPISAQAATAQTFAYEFTAAYWSGLSNGVKVVVTPACTGTVEVVFE